MQIVVELPEDTACHADPGRDALEALAIDSYRSGSLTGFQTRQLLKLSRFEFDRFLTDRNVHEQAYGIEDLQSDLETIQRIEFKAPPVQS